MLRPFRVDLHIHSVLSPCAALEMGPQDIAARAREAGIDLIALSDHNAMRNVPALAACAEAAGGPAVLAGMEVQTAEDIHVLALFPAVADAAAFEAMLWAHLPRVPNRTEVFGYQLVVDERHEVLEEVEHMLVTGVSLSVDEVVDRIHAYGGLAILAHVDREAFAYCAVLGDVPDELPVDAIELSRRLSPAEYAAWRKRLPPRPVVRNSDAHQLDAIDAGHCSLFLLEAPTFDEIALALRGEGGRRILPMEA